MEVQALVVLQEGDHLEETGVTEDSEEDIPFRDDYLFLQLIIQR